MLVIRKAQMDMFAARNDGLFAQELVPGLRAAFPDETKTRSDAALTEHAREALAQARGYGLAGKRDVARFVNITVLFGLDWARRDETRWMHETLLDDALGRPAQRLEWLVAECLERLERPGS